MEQGYWLGVGRRFLWVECCRISTGMRRFSTVRGLVADAGLLAAGMLMGRLGLEDLVDRTVCLGGWEGGAYPGRGRSCGVCVGRCGFSVRRKRSW